MSTTNLQKVAFGCQMLAAEPAKGYISGMEPYSVEEVREFFERYLLRKGQGAMKRAVEATKVSRQHLNRFKNKKTSLGWDTRKALLELMEEEGFVPRQARAMETPAPYPSEEPGIELVLALKLEAMAKELICADFTPTEKAEDFLKFIEGLADSLDAHVAELARVGGEHFKGGKLHLDPTVTKLRDRRILDLLYPLPDWLAAFPPSGPLLQTNHRKRFEALREAAGLTQWPNNALRHSFATYHLAAFQDAAKTAHYTRHESQDTLHRHYIDLATHEDGILYFNLGPGTLDFLAESRGILGRISAS